MVGRPLEVLQPLRRDREQIFADAATAAAVAEEVAITGGRRDSAGQDQVPLQSPRSLKSPRVGQNLPPSTVVASKMEPKAAAPILPPLPEALAHMHGTTMAESPHEPPARARAEAEAVPKMTRVDVDDDAKVDEDDPLVKQTSEFQSLRGA